MAIVSAMHPPLASGEVTDQDLAQIRQSIKQLEQRHAEDQARIQDLERRLKEAESKLSGPGTSAPSSAPAVAQKPAEAEPAAAQPVSPPTAVAEKPAQPEAPATKPVSPSPPTAVAEKPAQPAPSAGQRWSPPLAVVAPKLSPAPSPAPLAIPALTVFSSPLGNITLKPGLRLEPRFTYDTGTGNQDFFLRRFRLKAGGEAFGLARYYAEMKIDNAGRTGSSPSAQVETAWVDFPITPEFSLRAGQYDVPFSRNLLTSDARLLLMDRSQFTTVLSGLGGEDNTIGVLAHGRPFGGHFEYAANVSKNLVFQKFGMLAGRLVYNFWDPSPAGGYGDYFGSYLGQGQRLAWGVNGAYLPNAGKKNVNEFDLYEWGTDLFIGKGPFVLEAEYNLLHEDMKGGTPDVDGYGWHVQGGYYFSRWFELAARYQHLNPNKDIPDNRQTFTSVGFNTYLGEHYLKIQTDYTFIGGLPGGNVFQIQMVLDN